MSRGFSLLEVILVILIITVGVGGAFALAQRTTSTTTTISNQLIASYLAQEGIEIVRNIRDNNYVTIFNTGTGDWDAGGLDDSDCRPAASGCEADYDDSVLVDSADRFFRLNNAGFYNYDTGTTTPFKRKITTNLVDLGGGDEKIEVAVEVTWQERGRAHSVEAATEIYDWLNL